MNIVFKVFKSNIYYQFLHKIVQHCTQIKEVTNSCERNGKCYQSKVHSDMAL